MQELIIRYTGNLEALQSRIGFAFEALLGGYAIVRILEEDAPKLLAAPEILWTEVPARVYTTVTNGRVVSCISSVQARYPGLTGAGVLEEDKLFATLDPTSRALTLPDGRKVMLVDTVGLVSRLPHHLVEAFKSTLEEAAQADRILVISDGELIAQSLEECRLERGWLEQRLKEHGLRLQDVFLMVCDRTAAYYLLPKEKTGKKAVEHR